MEWYIAVITFLSASIVGALCFIIELVAVLNKSRLENAKLRIDLNQK